MALIMNGLSNSVRFRIALVQIRTKWNV